MMLWDYEITRVLTSPAPLPSTLVGFQEEIIQVMDEANLATVPFSPC